MAPEFRDLGGVGKGGRERQETVIVSLIQGSVTQNWVFTLFWGGGIESVHILSLRFIPDKPVVFLFLSVVY